MVVTARAILRALDLESLPGTIACEAFSGRGSCSGRCPTSINLPHGMTARYRSEKRERDSARGASDATSTDMSAV